MKRVNLYLHVPFVSHLAASPNGEGALSLKLRILSLTIFLQVDVTFDQILSMVKQLSRQQKLKLTKELEKELLDSRLSRLLKTFKTEELDLKTIDKEVESVRQEIYEKKS